VELSSCILLNGKARCRTVKKNPLFGEYLLPFVRRKKERKKERKEERKKEKRKKERKEGREKRLYLYKYT